MSFVYDRLVMRKRAKAVLAVVQAHAALSYTAKAHGAGRQMDNDVVDAPATVGKLARDHLDPLDEIALFTLRAREYLPLVLLGRVGAPPLPFVHDFSERVVRSCVQRWGTESPGR